MSSVAEDQKFGDRFLDDIKEFVGEEIPIDEVYDDGQIADHVRYKWEPDDVFEEDKLIEWAAKYDDPSDIIEDDVLKSWAKGQDPEDVVEVENLRAWAESHGYELSE